MARYTVSQMAARTGFSPSALRYYDKVGLVAPVARSEAGYRLYDERAGERLRFIARAKRLGLPLDDITDLLALWDGDECGPVQSRLGALVGAKLDDTRRSIAELGAFADELGRLQARLASARHAGPCGDGCACLADGPPAAVCDLTTATDDPADRMAVYRRLFAHAYLGRERTVAGIRFRFRADDGVEAVVRDLAARETRCCAFFAFTITTTGGEVLWDATVADDDTARGVLEEWFELPETLREGTETIRERFARRGLEFLSRGQGRSSTRSSEPPAGNTSRTSPTPRQ
ncbi:MAG TPA: MerR family transcriptional regulator [Acidimicrobiia bacterium]